MGLSWRTIPDDMRTFIERQKLFFVATAPADGRVNLSPKGLDTLRVLDERTVVYLDLTGSGNETAAHVTENGRMTMMFCAFDGEALTLRLYGRAELIRPDQLRTAIKPQRQRLSIEGAEHHGHAAVLGDVGGGFIAAASQVEIDHRALVQHAQRVEPFRRQVHASVGRRGGDEEQLLPLDEGAHVVGNGTPAQAHGRFLTTS